MSIQDRTLKPGTTLVAVSPARGPKRTVHRCEVLPPEEKGGKLRFRLEDGQTFTSISAAGSACMDGQACNGWRFWSVEGTESAEKALGARTTTQSAPKAAPKANAAGTGRGKGVAKPKRARKPARAAGKAAGRRQAARR
jgi:hypothetical protein